MQQPPSGPQPATVVPQGAAGAPYAARPTNSLAVVSLAAGVASYVLLPVVGAIIAVVTGHMARGQIRRTGEAGGGLALAGLVLGYLHFAIALVAIVVLLVVAGGLVALLATQTH